MARRREGLRWDALGFLNLANDVSHFFILNEIEIRGISTPGNLGENQPRER